MMAVQPCLDESKIVSKLLKRSLLLTAFALLILLNVYQAFFRAPDDDAIRARDGIHQPLRMPDRIILTFAGDPAHSMAVTWRTSADVQQAWAEIAPAEDGPGFADAATRVDAESENFESDLGKARYHSVRFADLEPETMYAYRVGDGETWSAWQQFTTLSDEPKPLEFLYVGDAQNDILSLWSRLMRQGYSSAPAADFIVHAGDLVNRGNRDAEWGEWFLAAGWIFGKTPSLPTPGNHEYPEEAGVGRALTPHWRPQFTLPENGPEGLEETCYYVDMQGVRFVALNSNERQQEQAAWLDKLLSDNPNRWTVVTHHHPIHSSAEGRDNPELRALWQPIYDKYGVDLVIQGHDHSYARTNLATGANLQSPNNGTVYVVSVSGPKMYEIDRRDWMARAAEDTQLFQIVRIDGDRLEYESRTARGLLYDAFELVKRADGSKELVNRIPDSPERRRDP